MTQLQRNQVARELSEETSLDFYRAGICIEISGEDAVKLLALIQGLKAFERGVDQALNEGDGVYRP